MRFLVYGAGAVGGYVGGSLAAAGHEVALVDRPAQAEIINRRGLAIRDRRGRRITRAVCAFTSPAQAFTARTSFDCLILAVKSFDTDAAIADLRAACPTPPAILCLQNGVDNEPRLAAAFGQERVIAGTALTAVNRAEPAEVVVEKERGFGLQAGHPLSAPLASALNAAGLATRLYAEGPAMKWSKLLTNLMANATAAICDLSADRVLAHPGLYRLEVGALREALAVMRARGLSVVGLPRAPTRQLAFAVRNLPPRLYQPAFRLLVARGRGDKKPSFHQDLIARRPRSEVSYLNGAVARQAAELGLAAPINRALTATLEAIVAGEVGWSAYQGQPDKLAGEILS